nr:MAG TPA: hypothetical protein [Caudoviricetes sp.]
MEMLMRIAGEILTVLTCVGSFYGHHKYNHIY